MADQMKLMFFAFMGRGEITRRLLRLAGVDFEETLVEPDGITFKRDYKQDTPFGQLPVLETGGQKLCQSLAINRYIARQYDKGLYRNLGGLYKIEAFNIRKLLVTDLVMMGNDESFAGKTLLEDARCDDVCYTVEDLRQPLVRIVRLRGKDLEKKAELCEEYEERLPVWLSHLEKTLISNNGGDGYFVGDSMTYADITFTCLLHPRGFKNFADIDLDLSPYPKLAALVDRVESHPIIAERIKEIPDTWGV